MVSRTSRFRVLPLLRSGLCFGALPSALLCAPLIGQQLQATPGAVQPPAGGTFFGGGDDCAAPDVISGPGVFGYSTLQATTGVEGQNETHCLQFGSTAIESDVWFQWTAPFTGGGTVSLCTSGSGDPKIAVYSEPGCPVDGSSVDCNDDLCGLMPEVNFLAVSGCTYRIQIGSSPGTPATSGTFEIEIESPPLPGSNYCTAAPNSVSQNGCKMLGFGSPSISVNDLTLSVINVPDQPAIFFFGTTQISAPFGNGTRCVGGSVTRLPILFGSGGSVSYQFDFGAYPLTPWTDYFFQCWYRDPAAGGAAFNLSDGYSIHIAS